MTAPIRTPEMIAGELISVVRTHQEITELFRVMKERLNLSDEFCDDRGGLSKGHTNKILGPSQDKNWGPTTFDLFCEMFCIEFHARIDPAAVKRMETIWEKRERPPYQNKRISKKLLREAKPVIFKETGRLGGQVRAALLTPKQRSKIARKAARKSRRLKAVSCQRRAEIARMGGLAAAAKRKAAISAKEAADTASISDSTPAAV